MFALPTKISVWAKAPLATQIIPSLSSESRLLAHFESLTTRVDRPKPYSCSMSVMYGSIVRARCVATNCRPTISSSSNNAPLAMPVARIRPLLPPPRALQRVPTPPGITCQARLLDSVSDHRTGFLSIYFDAFPYRRHTTHAMCYQEEGKSASRCNALSYFVSLILLSSLLLHESFFVSSNVCCFSFLLTATCTLEMHSQLWMAFRLAHEYQSLLDGLTFVLLSQLL